MSDKLKDMRVILGVILGVTILGSGLGFYITSKNHEKAITEKDNQIVALQSELDRIGQLTTVYKVRADVNSGKKIEETDLEGVEIPASISNNMITNPNDVVGNVYKVNVTGSTILSRDMVSDVVIEDDMRYLDVVTHYNPIGIEPDSYVDIRISMPMGEDYIAMSHKKVEQINSGIMKLVVTEEDIMTYNSMLVDALLYPGTQIYSVEYVEGGVQPEAETFYPMSKQSIAIAQKNPNLMSAIKEDILTRRDILETSGQDILIADKDLSKTLEKGRDQVLKSINASQKEVDKQRAEFNKQQEKLAKEQAKAEAKAKSDAEKQAQAQATTDTGAK